MPKHIRYAWGQDGSTTRIEKASGSVKLSSLSDGDDDVERALTSILEKVREFFAIGTDDELLFGLFCSTTMIVLEPGPSVLDFLKARYAGPGDTIDIEAAARAAIEEYCRTHLVISFEIRATS